MPRITKEQRCGRCRTCLRPQLKKACETVRAQLMSKMGEEGDLPLSLLGRLQEGPSSRSISELPRPQRPAVRASYATLEQETPNQQPPAKRQKPASEELPHEPLDPFSEALTDILSGSDGKVGERDAARLQKLFKDEITLEKRHVLLDVLQEHCLPPTKKLFVHGSGLKTLETWLSEAISHDKLQLAEKVLQVRLGLHDMPRESYRSCRSAAFMRCACSTCMLTSSSDWGRHTCSGIVDCSCILCQPLHAALLVH